MAKKKRDNADGNTTVNSTKVRKLRDAMAADMKSLKKFRENRCYEIKQYVGKHYSDNGTTEKVPLNLLELMISTYTTYLVGGSPAASVTTPHASLKPAAAGLKLALDHLFREIDLAGTLNLAVVESLFSIGVTKTALNYSDTVEFGGYKHDVGQPFCDVVQLDDFCFDTKAYSWEKVAYIGDRSRVAIADLKKCKLFNQDVVARLKPLGTNEYNKGDEGDRAEDISRGQNNQSLDKELVDECQIWDIWLPRENIILTIADDDSINEPLKATEWRGPEDGPYDILSYNAVPGNLMPLSPVAVMLDLHESTNKIFNKSIRQAMRQKTVVGYRPGAQNDAERIVNANDGETIRMDDPNAVKEFKLGGPDQTNTGFAAVLRQYFSSFAGNLDTLGGLSTQADTAKQETLLNSNASQRMKTMQNNVVKFVKSIMRKMAWYLWYDPFIDVPIIKRVAGTDIEIPTRFTAEDAEGDFLDYNVDIVPYSLQEHTPLEKLQSIIGMLNILGPHLEIMMQQGLTLDYPEMVSIFSEYGNLPELKHIFKPINGWSRDMNPVGNPPAKLNAQLGGGKTYDHTYQSRGSVQGMEGQAMQDMFSGHGAPAGGMMGAGGMQ